jgi:hypothetical protein
MAPVGHSHAVLLLLGLPVAPVLSPLGPSLELCEHTNAPGGRGWFWGVCVALGGLGMLDPSLAS